MFRRRDPVDEDALARAIKAAVADATTATVLASHIEQCKTDKADIKDALAAQDAERKKMHEANTAAFNRINRIIWIATGIFAALQFFASHGDIGTALTKVMHP